MNWHDYVGREHELSLHHISLLLKLAVESEGGPAPRAYFLPPDKVRVTGPHGEVVIGDDDFVTLYRYASYAEDLLEEYFRDYDSWENQ